MKCFCVFLAWSSGKSVRMWWVPLRAPQWSGACTELPQDGYSGLSWCWLGISVTWVCQNLKQVRPRWPQIGYKCELNVLTQSKTTIALQVQMLSLDFMLRSNFCCVVVHTIIYMWTPSDSSVNSLRFWSDSWKKTRLHTQHAVFVEVLHMLVACVDHTHRIRMWYITTDEKHLCWIKKKKKTFFQVQTIKII